MPMPTIPLPLKTQVGASLRFDDGSSRGFEALLLHQSLLTGAHDTPRVQPAGRDVVIRWDESP